MTFLTVLLAVLACKYWLGVNRAGDMVPVERWFDAASAWDPIKGMAAAGRFLLLVLGPTLAALIVLHGLDRWFFGIPWIAVALFTIALGAWQVDFDARFREQRAAIRAAEGDRGEEIGLQDAFRSNIIDEAFRSLYPALFWFLLLGPVGAIGWALAARYAEWLPVDAPGKPFAARTIMVLEWIPARITGLLMVLLGDFPRGLGRWLETLTTTQEDVAILLDGIAMEALDELAHYPDDPDALLADIDTQNVDLAELLNRLPWAWVGVAAVVVLLA